MGREYHMVVHWRRYLTYSYLYLPCIAIFFALSFAYLISRDKKLFAERRSNVEADCLREKQEDEEKLAQQSKDSLSIG